MGATAAIVGGGYLLKKANDYNSNRVKNLQQSAVTNATQAADAFAPPTIPPAPTDWSGAAQAGQAMTNAARRYRRQRGQGLASTTINGAVGDPSAAPTFRKQLLGR